MAQPEKRENSVLFSLRELRQIEENRVQEEEQAVRSAEEQKVRAKENAERAARDAEDARVRAERDAQLEIERAREGAEREARMRVESAEAAERQRQQAALEQQRLQHEMELRRADIAKKRPTWMLAVTGFALVAAVALIFFAVARMKDSEADRSKAAKAEAIAAQAQKDSQEAQDKVERLAADLAELDKKLSGATDSLLAANTQAERDAASKELSRLRQEKADMDRRIGEAKAAAAKAERRKGVKISAECQANPLAKGCMQRDDHRGPNRLARAPGAPSRAPVVFSAHGGRAIGAAGACRSLHAGTLRRIVDDLARGAAGDRGGAQCRQKGRPGRAG